MSKINFFLAVGLLVSVVAHGGPKEKKPKPKHEFSQAFLAILNEAKKEGLTTEVVERCWLCLRDKRKHGNRECFPIIDNPYHYYYKPRQPNQDGSIRYATVVYFKTT